MHNAKELWKAGAQLSSSTHDVTVQVNQGDAVSFVATMDSGSQSCRIAWDPVITYVQSLPTEWRPNPPSGQNLALQKSCRSKVLAFGFQPFKAVDGDDETSFAIYGDEALSSGPEWLQVDLEMKCLIDRYVVESHCEVAAWRPDTFALEKSDDGFTWANVDSVSNNSSERVERTVKPFAARYVRLYLPKGKPFVISEFELYHSGEAHGQGK
jgi:hypothetical protein